MVKKIGFVLGLFFILIHDIAPTFAETVDLSVGAAIPSDGASILLNPAGLAKLDTSLFDLSLIQNAGGDTNVAGIFSTGKGAFGYGLELRRLNEQWAPSAGFAASAGKFSLGVSATFNENANDSTRFTLGFRQEFNQYIIALVFPDAAHLTERWTLGFGIPVQKFLRLGFDFNFLNTDSSPGISKSQIAATAEFYSTRKYSLILTYLIQVSPFLATHSDVGFGLSIWLGKKVVAYGVYHSFAYDAQFGLKFALE